ncbi:MAG: hypothetical protein IJK23_15130 [Clostridia bacterium]|nr:hypothetical protein [Clostridia bacterium]
MNLGKIKIDRKWIAVGVVVFLVVAYVIILAAHRGVNANKTVVVTDEHGNEIEVQDGLYGRTELLFYFRDNDGSGMLFGVDADLTNHKIGVSAIPDDQGYLMNGAAVTIGTIYAGGGLEGVRNAVNQRTAASYQRVYICTPAQFAKVTDLLGKVTVNTPEGFSYSGSSATVNLKPGANAISGNDLYLYLKYGGGENVSYEMRGDVFAGMLRAYLTPENIAGGEKLFDELVNAAQTDITAYDRSAWEDRIAAAANSDTLVIENDGFAGYAGNEG